MIVTEIVTGGRHGQCSPGLTAQDVRKTMAKKSKGHHSVPRAHLDRFVGEDGLPFQHERENPEAVQVPPHKAARENWLYAPETGDDPEDDSLEVFLAEHIDGPGSEIIDKIIAGSELTEDERLQFASYLAFQEFRIPGTRDNVLKTIGDVDKKQVQLAANYPEYVRNILAEQGVPISDEQLNETCERWAKGDYEIKVHKAAWLALFGVASDTAPVIAGLHWMVAETVDYEVVVTDAPVVKVPTDKKIHGMFTGGWLSPSAESTFPLDPHHVLVIGPDGPDGRRTEAPRKWARDVNTCSVRQANRFVYSRSRERWVQLVLNGRPKR